MITESFLNSCFTLILNKNARVKRTKELYRDILDILKFSTERDSFDVPVGVQTKLDCITEICKLLMEDRTLENVIDSISFSENFKQHIDFLDTKINEELKDHVFQDIIKQIRMRKKINALFKNFDDLNKVLESIKDGTFDSIDDLIEDYESTVKTLYSNLMEQNRAVTIEAAASIDLLEDEYDHVGDMILKKYDRTNKTPTGFRYLDDKIMFGGYDPSRLYVWGGGSGSGKSTMLNNTLLKAATRKRLVEDMPKPGEIKEVYIYVTLENTIEESLMRTYQPLFDKETKHFLSDIANYGMKEIKNRIVEQLSTTGSTIMMKYFPAMSISAIDLMGVIDEAKEKYPNSKIAGLYVDYLDLLKTDTKFDLYRIELGQVTLSLKTLAVQYNIPVITATQLGRTAYRVSDARELGVDQISESIKKVEHADFVGLLVKVKGEENRVLCNIGKNRSGQSNVALEFNVDFSKFSFLSASPRQASHLNPDSTSFDPWACGVGSI